MADFKYTKFRIADDTSSIIRDEVLSSGCLVIFRVSGSDLSTLATEYKYIDFDMESDDLLEDLEVSAGTGQVYFEWIGDRFHRM